jgi:hypothetical protein
MFLISGTKITTSLRKFYLNMSKFKLEFYLSFTVGGSPAPPPPTSCYFPADLRSGIIYIWTRYPKINCTGMAGPQLRFLPGTYSCIFCSCSWFGLILKCKFISTIPLYFVHLHNLSTVRKQTELPLHCM